MILKISLQILGPSEPAERLMTVSCPLHVFGISIAAEILFFFETETFFFNFHFQGSFFFSFFPTSWGDTSFYKLENKPRPSKILKVSNVLKKMWFQGPFYDGKKPHAIDNQILSLNVVLVSVLVLSENISQFGFQFQYRAQTKILVLVPH